MPIRAEKESRESLFALKIALGMHSPRKTMTIHETTISKSSRMGVIKERAEKSMEYQSNNSFQNTEPNKTTTVRKKLKPTTLEPIKREGLSKRFDNNIPLLAPCFFFNSIFSRLAEIGRASCRERG